MMRKPTVRWNALFVFTLLLSIVSLYIEQMEISGLTPFIFTNLVDLAILFILVAEIIVGFKKAPYRLIYLKRNAVSLVFSVVFTTLFIYNKYITIGAYIAGKHRCRPVCPFSSGTSFLYSKCSADTAASRVSSKDSICARPSPSC
jgi:hypothetical protein